MNSDNIPDFIKDNAKINSHQSISDMMKSFDKAAVQQKLKEIGMNDIAQKLERLSKSDIEKIISSNPQILKKAEQIINDRGNKNG